VTIGDVDVRDIFYSLNANDYMKLVTYAGKVQYSLDLLSAYTTLREVAPELTGYLESIENEEVKIQYANLRNALGTPNGTWVANEGGAGGTINIDFSQRGSSVANIACLIGHEAFHAAVSHDLHLGPNTNFAGNEIFAYSFEYKVGQALGINREGFASHFSNVNPYQPDTFSQDILKTGAQYLFDHGNYFTGDWFHGIRPLPVWDKSCPNGTKLIITAQAVWIH
jgi:hypothetical protein